MVLRLHLFDTPDVFLIGFPLPGVDRDAGGGDGSSRVILSAEDVAAGPLHLQLNSLATEPTRATHSTTLTSAPNSLRVSISTAV